MRDGETGARRVPAKLSSRNLGSGWEARRPASERLAEARSLWESRNSKHSLGPGRAVASPATPCRRSWCPPASQVLGAQISTAESCEVSTGVRGKGNRVLRRPKSGQPAGRPPAARRPRPHLSHPSPRGLPSRAGSAGHGGRGGAARAPAPAAVTAGSFPRGAASNPCASADSRPDHVPRAPWEARDRMRPRSPAPSPHLP